MTAELRAEIRQALARDVWQEISHRCTHWLAALVDENERLETAHKEAEDYAAEGWAWVDEFLKLGGWKDVFVARAVLAGEKPLITGKHPRRRGGETAMGEEPR